MSMIPKLDSFLDVPLTDKLLGCGTRLLGWESLVAVVELTPHRRDNPRPDDPEGVPIIKIRVTGMEIAARPQEAHLRTVQQALYRIRTGLGTLDEHLGGDHERTLELAGAVLLDPPHGGGS